jgi:putative transposase
MPVNSPGNLRPFWNKDSFSHSNKLWLPTNNTKLVNKKDYNTSLQKLGLNSWFDVNQLQSNNPEEFKLSLPYIDKVMSSNLKCKKIQLFPNKKQRDILNEWFHTIRWVYNKCLESITNNEPHNRKELRKKWLNGPNIKNNHRWSENTPSAIRDYAIDDLLIAYKTNLESGKRFKMKYRSKKDSSESIVIPKSNYTETNVFYPSYFKDNRKKDKDDKSDITIKSKEKLPTQLNHDTRLQRTKLGNFYLCVLDNIEIKSENQAPKVNNIISLDPGVRTFVTGYDPNGNIYEWGKGDVTRLFKLGCQADKLKSKVDSDTTIKHRTRYRLKRKVLKIFKRIKNLVDTLHKKLAKWLCENYCYILIPDFKSSGMVSRKERKIKNKTVRNLLTWSHYRFRQRLLLKAREYLWCKIIETTEEYTSKTCGNCGTIKNNLGGNKIFKCSHCKTEMDRDFNGARNILIKYFSQLVKPKLNIVSIENCIITTDKVCDNTKGIYTLQN